MFRKCIAPLAPYVPGRPIADVKREFGLAEVVKLASNENPWGCSPHVEPAVVRNFQESAVYPDGYCTRLRSAVSNFYGIPAEHLVFGAGTDEVIAMLGKIFIEPGDECITGAVTFSQYAAAVESMGGVMRYAPMRGHDGRPASSQGERRGHGFDLNALLAEISPKTKLIFIANPNNPTGTYFSQAAQDAFMAKVPPHIYVVFDEAYAEYVTAQDYPNTWETLRNYPNAMLLKTFSKVYGLAAFRVGFGVCAPAVVAEMEKIRCPFNVSLHAQTAAVAALADQHFVAESRANNAHIMEETVRRLTAMGCDCIPSQANFVMLDAKTPSRPLFEALMAKGYIIRAGAAFGMDNYIRITIGTPPQMDGLLAALEEVLSCR